MLSIILPTFNEAENIRDLIEHIGGVLQGSEYEIIVIDDDSPDGTWQKVREIQKKHPEVHCIRRQGVHGLSSAVVEGFDHAKGEYIIVMDADGQHDAALLLQVKKEMEQGADLCIGSRYIKGGSVGDWVRDRRIISSLGTKLAHLVSRVPVTDPLGGFFGIKKSLYESIKKDLEPTGFKILLEILATVPKKTRVKEVPLIFRMRLHGESKLNLRVQIEFLMQIARIFLRQIIPSWTMNACFGVICFALCISSLLSIWAIYPLYDHETRTLVQKAMRTTADHQGWLLSDMDLVSVTKESITINYQQHRRYKDPSRVCTFFFYDLSLLCKN